MTGSRNACSMAFLVGLLVLLVPLPFFSQFLNPNNATRFLLTQALVENGDTRIDAHQALTVDKAMYDGHYYSDKAPGMALMAIPAYSIGLTLAGGAEALDFVPEADKPAEDNILRMLTYRLMILTTSGLLTALAAAAFYLFALRTSCAPGRSLLATLTVFLGTPILGWSVNLFGHAAAGSALFLGFFLLSGLGPGRSAAARSIGAGFLLGLAIVIEYTTAPAVALIAGYGIWRLRSVPLRQSAWLVLLGIAGCVVALTPLLIYHTISFGGPLSTGYSRVVGFEGMEEGFMGVTWPRLEALWGISVGRRRGLLWLSPILIMVPWAIWGALQARWMTAEVITGLVITVYFILLNASYHYWDGGASLGPRHITPSLPFLCIAMIWLWARAEGWHFRILAGLLGISVAINVAAAATTMTPIGGGFPLREHIASRVLSGDTWFAWYDHLGLGQVEAVLIWVLIVAIPVGLLWKRLRAV